MKKLSFFAALVATVGAIASSSVTAHAFEMGKSPTQLMTGDPSEDLLVNNPSIDPQDSQTGGSQSEPTSDSTLAFNSTQSSSAISSTAIASTIPLTVASGDLEPAPEPLTIFGSVLALGFGGLLHREYSRKQSER
jgi:hypothetical protein